jgi:hypothetical protein
VVLPDLAQYLDLSKLLENFWRVRSLESPKKPKAIGTYRLRYSSLAFLPFGSRCSSIRRP